MFDLLTDEIVYDNRTIARLVPNLPASFIDAIALDLCAPPEAKGWVSDEEHIKALVEEEKNAYKRGEADGILKGAREAETAHRLELDTARALAFKQGRRAAAADLDKAADLARVDALLARVALVEAKLRQALNGRIIEPGSYKPRPLKVTEYKTVVRECFVELGRAKAEMSMTRQEAA